MPNLKAEIKYVDYGAAIGALLDVKRVWGDKDEYPDEVIDRCILALECLPTFDPEELRPRGEWKFDEVVMEYYCSWCGRSAPIGMSSYILHNFCPGCGADMRGRKNDGC